MTTSVLSALWTKICDNFATKTQVIDTVANATTQWYTGTAVTAAGTTSVSGSKAGDFYLNTSTFNVYKASAANTWTLVGCLKSEGLPIGSTTATSLASLPTTTNLIVATISANQSSVSISNGVTGLPAGCELHVIVKAAASVQITLPTSGIYVNCSSEDTLSLDDGKYGELNFISDGTKIYVRGTAQ